jgi:hypothetical protein
MNIGEVNGRGFFVFKVKKALLVGVVLRIAILKT